MASAAQEWQTWKAAGNLPWKRFSKFQSLSCDLQVCTVDDLQVIVGSPPVPQQLSKSRWWCLCAQASQLRVGNLL